MYFYAHLSADLKVTCRFIYMLQLTTIELMKLRKKILTFNNALFAKILKINNYYFRFIYKRED